MSVLQRAGGDPLRAPTSYSAGQSIVLEVRFTAPVAVDAGGSGGGGGGGTPYLELRTGSAGAHAAYSSGNGTDALEFEYAVRGGDIAARLSYAGTTALALNGGAITAAGSGAPASVALPKPGAPGSLSHTDSPAVRIGPEPGRPVLDIGILDEAGASPGGGISAAAAAAAERFNERQGRAAGALIVNATVYGAGTTAESAAAALRAAHAGGAGPSVYVGPSTDRGLHAAMPYASENGIVLVSAGSTAPSLAVGGDQTFRLLPSDRLEAEALARLARASASAESMHAVLENATYGPPAAAGSLEDANLPPPQGRFLHGFDEALSYAGVPSLSGTVSLGGAAGSYAAAAAAEALDASVRPSGNGGGSPAAAVVYLGSPEGLAALAGASAGYPALASAPWFASGPSAGSALLAGDGPAAAFAAQVGLEAARWSLPGNDLTREINSLLMPGADASARHRAYAAYDAVFLLGTAASASGARDDAVDPAAVADLFPGTAAAYAGALGDIALDYAGDAWVPARYDRWTVGQPAGDGSSGGTAAAFEWTRQPGALDEERACSIALTRAKIDYGPIDSGQTSRPHLQSIVNTGQLPFAQVALTATPWHVGSPGACAPGDRPSLPVGLSEIRTEHWRPVLGPCRERHRPGPRAGARRPVPAVVQAQPGRVCRPAAGTDHAVRHLCRQVRLGSPTSSPHFSSPTRLCSNASPSPPRRPPCTTRRTRPPLLMRSLAANARPAACDWQGSSLSSAGPACLDVGPSLRPRTDAYPHALRRPRTGSIRPPQWPALRSLRPCRTRPSRPRQGRAR